MSVLNLSSRKEAAKPAGAIPAGRPSSAAARLLAAAAIERAEAIVREETAALKASRHVDLRESTNRKSHSIVDLNASLGVLTAADVSGELLRKLQSLQLVLADNISAIRIELDAAKEISKLLADRVHDAESDGTYSRMSGGRGP